MNDDFIGRSTKDDGKRSLHDTHRNVQDNSRVRDYRAVERMEPGIKSFSASTPGDVLRTRRIKLQLALEFDRGLTDADLRFLRSSGICLF